MARRTKVIQITDENRDRGKSFLLTEMPADQGEWWAIRALIVMGNAGVTMPAGVLESGMSGMAYLENTKGVASALFAIGLRMLPGIDPSELKPLLDEMNSCIQYKPPGNLPATPLDDGPFSQIDEISTRLKLRAAVLELHLGFSLAAAVSTTDTAPNGETAPAS